MDKTIIQSSNIKCGGCASNIENGLKELPGISSVSVNIEKNLVTIEGNEIDKSVITEKLKELGYPEV